MNPKEDSEEAKENDRERAAVFMYKLHFNDDFDEIRYGHVTMLNEAGEPVFTKLLEKEYSKSISPKRDDRFAGDKGRGGFGDDDCDCPCDCDDQKGGSTGMGGRPMEGKEGMSG